MLPRVGVVYTKESALSLEDAQLAQYVALCLAFSGRCAKTWLVGVDKNGKALDTSKSKTDVVAVRCDGAVLESDKLPAETFEHAKNWRVLSECDLWLLMVEADDTIKVAEYLHKTLGKPDDKRLKRVVLSIQTTERRLAQLNVALPDAIVLHGGAAFQVVKDDEGRLKPLSNGCFFVERLSKEKSSALYALDVLEGTGIQVLCRNNIQAMKWGCTMLRVFYYINALTQKSVMDGLRDRKTRFLFLQALLEMDELFQIVVASVAATNKIKSSHNGGKSNPDTSAATLFPVRALMVLLPLPDWIFNSFIIRAFDVGLGAPSSKDKSVITTDLMASPPLQTKFDAELRDVFELAAGRNVTLPVLELLRKTFLYVNEQQLQRKKDGIHPTTLVRFESGVLLAEVKLFPHCTTASRTFFLKSFATFVLTLLLGLYFFVV